MKSSLKKGKPVIEMHAPDRRALENAKAVCEFISRNTDRQLLKESAVETVIGPEAILAVFANDKPLAMNTDSMLAEKPAAESAA